jgi:hypothetical protein
LVIFRIGTESPLPISRNVEELREACSALGLTVQQPYVVLLQGQMVHPAYLWERQNKVVQLAVIPATVEQPRLDAPHEQLKEKGVALIGCGSLGSKVGSMLARSGVGRFVLVDDDVLLPDNLIRNDLDGATLAHIRSRRSQGECS